MKRRGALLLTAAAAVAIGWAARPDPATEVRRDARADPRPEAIEVIARPLALDPERTAAGELQFLFGAELTATGTSRFGGVSGLIVAPDGRSLDAVTDEGDHVSFGLEAGRVDARTAGEIAPLVGEDGRPLQGKAEADAEATTQGPQGPLVSFERDHRIVQYGPAYAGPPRRITTPPTRDLPENGGFEALAWVQALDAFAVGAEDGRIWLCPNSGAACRQVVERGGPDGYKLTDLAELPGRSDLVATYRAFDPFRGWRALVAHVTLAEPGGAAQIEVLGKLPQRDNFEGISAVADDDGSYRLYVVSDDNFSPKQRTLLLAFRWTPKEKGPASPPAPSN